MDTAKLVNQMAAWAKIKVIVVGKNHLGTEIKKTFGGDGFDRGVGTDRHKNRGVDDTVGGLKNSGSSMAKKFAGDTKFEHG